MVPGAAHVAGNAAVLQGWPLSAEGFWYPCGSRERLFGVSNLSFVRNGLLESPS